LKNAGGITRISGLVFTKDGKKLDHTYRVVQDLCRELRIEDFRFHDLRHSAVTNLRAAGVDVETIMKIVGHSSVEMFLRYRAVDEEELNAAMEKLEARQTHPPTPIQHHSREQEAISS
jgi:integrase